MNIEKKTITKITISFVICTLIRLMPYKIPNFEPIMSCLLPFSKLFGYSTAFYFGFLNIFIFDILTFKIGTWTLINSFTYGLIGILSAYLFRKNINQSEKIFDSRKNIFNYAKVSITGTLLYDIVTGVIMGPILHNQLFIEALVGQIPFSLMHLLGNIFFAITVSPLIEYWVIKGKQFKLNWKQL